MTLEPTEPPTEPTTPGASATESTTVRNILLGVIALLIGVLLVAVGFLGRVVTEPEATVVPASTDTSAPADSDNGGSQPAASSDADFLILDEILRILEEDFVEPDRIDAEYLYSAAINGIFEALDDPHSTYIDPQTYQMSRDDFSGAFQGIGATVDKLPDSDYIIIVRPLPETPAEAAGILAGDLILEVDGQSAEGWSVQEGVIRIRGPQGSPVELKVRHTDGSEEFITIIRDEIDVASVSTFATGEGGKLLDSEGEEATDIAYIRIFSFTRRTPDELQAEIEAAEARGAVGILLDVRSNPGGLLVETIQIADMFLDEGEIVTEVDRDGNEQTASAQPGQSTMLPLVILQDEFSASGSELLAAALQENNGRATIIGTSSFGKGTVNHVRELSNGGAVYVSIARWLTPDRNLIEGLGVTPDIVVEFTIEDIDAGRDVQAERAIDVLRDLADQASVSAAS
jgi:carboxyl-terminal processing protease